MDLILPSILEDKSILNMIKVHKTSVHVAIIISRNKVLAIATNQVGSRSKGAGYSDCTIHAERNVVKQLGDHAKLRGASLYVFRISKCREKSGMDKIQNSEPCYDCHVFLEKCVKKYGLRNVFYSTNEFVEMDFHSRPAKKHFTPLK